MGDLYSFKCPCCQQEIMLVVDEANEMMETFCINPQIKLREIS